jgi:Met-zincin/Domain of unknown function (DUF5117)
MRTRRLIASTLATLLLGGCVQMPPPSTPRSSRYPLTVPEKAGLAHKATPPGAPTTPAEGSAAKDWNAATRSARRHDGFLPVWQRRDGATAIELNAFQLDREMGLSAAISKGVGEAGLYDASPLTDTLLVRFVRMGDRVLLIARDKFFVAPAGSGWESGVDQNRAESVLAALPIVVEDEARGRLLVDATGLLLTDLGGIGRTLASAYEGKEPGLDRERSRVTAVHGFPRNTEIDSQLAFVSSVDPPYGFYGVADPRSLSVGMRLSFFALPERPMTPRAADDRVGYFSSVFFDPSRARRPWIAYVNRRRLEKKYPERAKSEPVQPIVYYIDPSVPDEWRPFIKQGVLAWNAAFELAGFENAVQVREQLPEDYSPEDIRYSTIRWAPSYGGAWGIGPSQVDPRSGEILNSDIVIGGNVLRSGDVLNSQLIAPAPAPSSCGMAESASRGLAQADLLLGAVGRPVPKQLIGDLLRNLVTHEVGHTLGLRHNFRSSATVPFERLQDKEFTGQNGVCNSVMDYCEINIATDASKQGHFISPGLGEYDRWAIRYGYSPFGAPDEAAGLGAIADEANAPLHAFQTDEDTRLGAYAMDPSAGMWDLGDEPLRYASGRIGLIDAAIPQLDKVALEQGDSYYELRRAFGFLLSLRLTTLEAPIRLIGGSFVARVHKGQKGEAPVFTPVSGERQRAALRLVIDRAFAPGAWPLPADVLVRLAPWRGGSRGNGGMSRLDYPAHTVVLNLQTAALIQLVHPARLARLVDGTLTTPAGKAFTVGELFGTLTDGIWTELTGGAPRDVDSLRANLQLTYIDVLAALLLPPSIAPMPLPTVPIAPWDGPTPIEPVPAEARAAVRAELERLATRLDAARSMKHLPAHARAHFAEARARITRTLNATQTQVLK